MVAKPPFANKLSKLSRSRRLLKYCYKVSYRTQVDFGVSPEWHSKLDL